MGYCWRWLPRAGPKWATDMFDHTSHDFGAVARGAKVEHRFRLRNFRRECPHHVRAVQLRLHEARSDEESLKTWETADMVATIDTRDLLGRRDATITVTFDQPFPGEVQLQVHCNIRGDVVVQPGSVVFWLGRPGQHRSSSVTSQLRRPRKLGDSARGEPQPEPSAVPVVKSRVGGRVDYDWL